MLTFLQTEKAVPTAAAAGDSDEADDEEEEVCSTESGTSETSSAGAIGGSPTQAPTDVVVIPSTATVIPVQTAPYGNGTEHTIIPTAAPSASGFIKSYY